MSPLGSEPGEAHALREASLASKVSTWGNKVNMTSIDAMLRSGVFDSSARDFLSADTLPPECYTSLPFHELEVDGIFRKEWLCLGHVGQIPGAGDYFVVTIADDPLIPPSPCRPSRSSSTISLTSTGPSSSRIVSPARESRRGFARAWQREGGSRGRRSRSPISIAGSSSGTETP
jgi:hypothetical protein